MSFWDNMRLSYGPFHVFTYLVMTIVLILFAFIGYYHPYGTPLDWLGVFLTVVILLLMIVEPLLDVFNAPRVKILYNAGARIFDFPKENEARYTFQIFNFGRKPAVESSLEVHALNMRDYGSKPVGFKVFEHMVIPFIMKDQKRWLSPKCEFDLIYNKANEEVMFQWLKRKNSDSDDIGYEQVTKGPFKVDNCLVELSLTWEYSDKTDLLVKVYSLDWSPNGKGKQDFPTLNVRGSGES